MLNKLSNTFLQANNLEDLLSVEVRVANLLRVGRSQAMRTQLLYVHPLIRAAVISHSLSLLKFKLSSDTVSLRHKNKLKIS